MKGKSIKEKHKPSKIIEKKKYLHLLYLLTDLTTTRKKE